MMDSNVAKKLIRAVGTLTGIMGVGTLSVSLLCLYSGIAQNDLGMILFFVLALLFAIYFVWVGYLVWFRFSPRAVMHVCGMLGFYSLGLIFQLIEPAAGQEPDLLKSLWFGFGGLGSLVFVFWGYRAASRYLSRVIFSDLQS